MSWNRKTMNNLNDFISQAASVLSCGPECQKQKELQELEEKYLVAQQNLISAPSQLDEARKNYMIQTQGEQAYYDYEDDKLKQESDKISDEFVNNFNKKTNEITSKINSYKDILANSKNILELHRKYKKENHNLENKLKDNISEIQTNDRKTFYEDQSIDNLKLYYYFLIIIYIIIIIAILISFFIYPSIYSFYQRIFIFIVLFIYPFISLYIAEFILWLYNRLISVLPKNIYKDI